MILELVFIGSLSAVAYVYVGYPFILWVLGKLRGKTTTKRRFTPNISLIIAVHNEEAVISEKIDNSLDLDYPPDNLEIIIVSDGSTDRTEELVERNRSHPIRLFCLDRCGKMRALEFAVTQARGDILVFTDANTWIARSSLRELAAHFADLQVGGVCGCKRIGREINGEFTGLGEGIYWKYDQLLKILESRLGKTIAADGALYAIRKELFTKTDDPAQADDIAISIRVPLQGKALIFETEAVAWEAPPVSAEGEFRRKMRVANHAFRSFWNFREALNPWRSGFYAIEVWSHKLLRYFVPFPLAAAFLTNYLLLGSGWFYSVCFTVQATFYLLALIGALLRHTRTGQISCLHTPFYVCLAHTAALRGVLSALFGTRIVKWQQTRTTAGLRAGSKEFV
jgi:cellulose synthase/poly-beta-1,6-N-acetylglucosamine synthase-like glycosyltransferase